jgi:hypothetical protein
MAPRKSPSARLGETKMESCYLCHSPEVIHRFDIGEYPLLRCKACGLEWLSPQPDDAVLGEIYGSQYHESRMQNAECRGWL